MKVRVLGLVLRLAGTALLLLPGRTVLAFTPRTLFANGCSQRTATTLLAASTTIFPDQDIVDKLERKKKTLYDVLGATQSDTRAELKKKYLMLARKTHPDALIAADSNQTLTLSANATDQPDFAEIAAAWRILSDSKMRIRYDRSLQAEQLTEDIAVLANQLGRQAAPAAKMFEQVAIPFLRRTTATTLASFQAAAQELAQEDNAPRGESSSSSDKDSADPDFVRAFQKAVNAAKRAGQYVDSMELDEKSQALHDRAVRESARVAKLRGQLSEVTRERLTLALHTADSGLSSADALYLWQEFNQTIHEQPIYALGQLMGRHTMQEEIEELGRLETTFVESQQTESLAQKDHQSLMQKHVQAKTELQQAVQAEEKARKALEMAQERLSDRTQTFDKIDRDLYQADTASRKSSHEMKKTTNLLKRQAEKVRTTLLDKEREVLEEKGEPGENVVSDSSEDEEDEERQERLQRIKGLRREERTLANNVARLELLTERLLSRADKLRVRAEEIKMNDR